MGGKLCVEPSVNALSCAARRASDFRVVPNQYVLWCAGQRRCESVGGNAVRKRFALK